MKWFKDIGNAIFPNEDGKDKSIYKIIPFDTLLQMLTEHIMLMGFPLTEYINPRYMTFDLSSSR